MSKYEKHCSDFKILKTGAIAMMKNEIAYQSQVRHLNTHFRWLHLYHKYMQTEMLRMGYMSRPQVPHPYLLHHHN